MKLYKNNWKQLSNPNTEIQHVFKQNDIVSIDIEKMYEDYKKSLLKIEKDLWTKIICY